MPKLNALVAGSTGYIGTQLIKILVKHKYIAVKIISTSSNKFLLNFLILGNLYFDNDFS